MGQLTNFLTGTKVLEEIESPINGKIQVIKNLAFGTYIKVGGLTQSGGVVYDVWRTTLRQVQRTRIQTCLPTGRVHRCLILGLAGGSTAKLVRKYWGDNVEIIGVDIDPVMVELGKKYLELDDYNVKVVIKDAYDFLKTYNQQPTTYNVILVDLYVGDEFPQKFEGGKFLKLILKLLTVDGIAVFNRLYYGEKRAQAMKFLKKLEKNFRKVDIVFPEANVMFICSK